MQSSIWIKEKKTPLLQDSEIHIWRVLITNFEDHIDQYWNLLNNIERKKAKKFIKIIHQNNFIIVHGILRKIISHYLNIKPEKIMFINNKFGKPYILSTANNLNYQESLNFNISHSNDVAIFAFSKNTSIGVDIEYNRQDIEISEITKRFFNQNEANAINKLPIEVQLEHFFTYWTCKEAFVKAIGKGLSYSLKNFSIDLDNFKIKIFDPKYKDINWTLLKFDTFPHYSAAIASSLKVNTLRLIDFVE